MRPVHRAYVWSQQHAIQRRVVGYPVVEFLTVVLILVVLVALAIPMVISQRQAAWRSSTAADVRNTAIIVEAAEPSRLPVAIVHDGRTVLVLAADSPSDEPSMVLTSGGSMPGHLQVVAETRSSPGVLLTLERANDTHFCLCGYHERLGPEPAAIYDSTRGGLVDACELPAGGCATASNP